MKLSPADQRSLVVCACTLAGITLRINCVLSHVCMCGHLQHVEGGHGQVALDIAGLSLLACACVFSFRSSILLKEGVAAATAALFAAWLSLLLRNSPFPALPIDLLTATLILAILIVETARRLRRWATREGASRPSHECPECAHDLRGCTMPGCPECGWRRNRTPPSSMGAVVPPSSAEPR